MITKCINLFNLIPTTPTYRWLIAADWLEEENKYTEANAFRENIFTLEIDNIRDGFYENDAYGWGDGHAWGPNSFGFGHGDGGNSNSWGIGNGSSNGNGEGFGYGYGSGDGYRDGVVYENLQN
jgi:hypothetical protein